MRKVSQEYIQGDVDVLFIESCCEHLVHEVVDLVDGMELGDI